MQLTKNFEQIPNAAIMLCIGVVGALIARQMGVPMPFMVGALASVGTYSAWRTAQDGGKVSFPQPLRKFFVALIGVMIGASFGGHLLSQLPAIWPSLLVMLVYIVVALAGGYVLFRYVGGYDPITSLYSALPGGLIEAVALGEEAGGDVRILALQHFARIVVVVVAVPFLYLIWSGNAVGSAAGQSLDARAWSHLDVLEIIALALAGIWLGPKLRLPAAYMVGPLMLSAVFHGTDILHVASPYWLLALSQLVVGTGLGTSFAGSRPSDLLLAFGLGMVYVSGLLVVGYAVAAALSPVLPFDFDTLFVSFAPGGVTEMGLIALSLGISPLVVVAHHIFRIFATVVLAGVLTRRLKNGRRTPES